MQNYIMTRNVHVRFGQQVLEYTKIIVSSEAKGTFSTPKMINDR